MFDCLHDMGDPVGAARRVREALAPDGTWLLVEPFAADKVEDNLNPVGRLYYAGSTFLCVPNGLSQPGGYALGAQAGEAAIRQVVDRRRLHPVPPGRADTVQPGLRDPAVGGAAAVVSSRRPPPHRPTTMGFHLPARQGGFSSGPVGTARWRNAARRRCRYCRSGCVAGPSRDRVSSRAASA